ncbi:MAG: helix-turn-helix transcriptional regulator [Azospirillaceae bacterium]
MEADPESFLAAIGARLRALRKRERLSLEELSRLSGVGIATLSHLENGSRDIRLSTLARILRALDIGLADLSTRDVGRRDTDRAEDEAAEEGGYDLEDLS